MTAAAAARGALPVGRIARRLHPRRGQGRVAGGTAFLLLFGALALAGSTPAVAAAGVAGSGSVAKAGQVGGGGSGGGASSTATLRTRAAALAATITGDGRRLTVIGERYLAAEETLGRARIAESSARAAVRRIDRRLGADRQAVRAAAVEAYVAADSDSDVGLILDAHPDDLGLSETYLSAVTGRLETAAAALADDRLALVRSLGQARAAAARASASLAAAGSARSGALATLAAERRLLETTNGRLATLVAAAAAARARAAALAAAQRAERAAALAAAQRAAAERAAAAKAAQAAKTAPAAPATKATQAPPAHHAATTAQVVVDAPGATGPPDAGAPTDTGTASPGAGGSGLGSVIPASLAQSFAGIRNCEAGGDYAENTGNGYYGAYQFSLGTWAGLGEPGLPSQAAPAVQDAAAYRLYQQSGWASWPACAAILGLG